VASSAIDFDRIQADFGRMPPRSFMRGERCAFHELETVVLKSSPVIAAGADPESGMAVAQRSGVKRVAAT
jgi:hypothetical protein